MKPVVIHGAARAELDEAMAFYENCAHGLGVNLQSRVAEAIHNIQRSPNSWPPHKRTGLRKYFVQRFPFTIFYIDLPAHIWIIAVAHTSRRPDYWKRRLD